MSRKASPGIALLKQIAIIPIIAITVLLFTAKGCSEDLTGAIDQQHVNAEQNDASYWELVIRTDESGNVIKEIIEISLITGETIEMQQMVGGSHMWDFYHKAVPSPPNASEGLRYGEFRTGDFLKLILEQDSRVSIMVDFHSIKELNNKIYRFDTDPAGLKELFAKL